MKIICNDSMNAQTVRIIENTADNAVLCVLRYALKKGMIPADFVLKNYTLFAQLTTADRNLPAAYEEYQRLCKECAVMQRVIQRLKAKDKNAQRKPLDTEILAFRAKIALALDTYTEMYEVLKRQKKDASCAVERLTNMLFSGCEVIADMRQAARLALIECYRLHDYDSIAREYVTKSFITKSNGEKITALSMPWISEKIPCKVRGKNARQSAFTIACTYARQELRRQTRIAYSANLNEMTDSETADRKQYIFGLYASIEIERDTPISDMIATISDICELTETETQRLSMLCNVSRYTAANYLNVSRQAIIKSMHKVRTKIAANLDRLPENLSIFAAQFAKLDSETA